MLWYDPNFDYDDKLAYKYMKFNGEYYDVGTIAQIKGPYGPVVARFCGWKENDRGCFELVNHKSYGLYSTYNKYGVSQYCLEIIVPVKPSLQQLEMSCKSGGFPDRDRPPSWDIEVAWIWYIVIMVVAVIFKDRFMIWTFVSAIFFLWKNGFLNKK